MRAGLRGSVALAGAACLVGAYLAVPMSVTPAGAATRLVKAAAATPPSAPQGQAKYSGFASGDELHLGALQNGGASVADVEQGFSGASVNTANLTSPITDGTTGTVIQPAQAPSTNAYGMGSGLEVGVGPNNSVIDQNQIKLLGKAESIAPPISPPVTKTFTVPANPLISGSSLTGRSSAVYDPQVCTLGQPISTGLGDGTGTSILPSLGALPVAGTGITSSPASTARTDSSTFLSSNGNNTFGLSTLAHEIIAPITVTVPAVAPLPPLVSLSITLSGNQAGTAPANPVTLQATSPGDGTNSVQLTNDNFLTINASLSGVTIPIVGATGLDLSALTAPRTISLGGLGSIVINTLTNTSSGKLGQANFTLFGINLTVPGLGTQLLNFTSGHMIVSASNDSEITCPLKITKTSTPPSVQAGNQFIYTIFVPDPAKIPLYACDLTNISVVDTISDAPGGPTFQVVQANNGGTIVQSTPNMATVSFSKLTHLAGAPPLELQILVSVPSGSPPGIIQDNAQASASCGPDRISGGVTLEEPKVSAAPVTPAAASQPVAGAGGQPGALPRTGGQGGLWQPGLGVGLLALAGGAFALLRRSRRRLSGS